MKKLIALLLALTMVFALCACGAKEEAAPAAAAPAQEAAPADPAFTITMKLGYTGNDETLSSTYMVKWAEAVKAASDGRIVIETYSSGQLGTGVEMIEAVDLGTLDMTLADYSLVQTYLPEIGILSLPCIIEDYDHMWEIYNGEVGQELNARLEANSNLKLLGTFYNGFRYIGSVKALNGMEDCKGLIIRSPESDIYVNTFKLYGMNPTPLPLGDVYSGLQTGVVEGVDSPIENFVTFSFGEVAPYILQSRHLASALPVAVNNKTWAKIPAADQELIIAELDKVLTELSEATLAKEDEVFETLKSQGVTFTEFGAEDRAALVEAFKGYWTEFASENNCQDLLDMILATL